MRRLHVLHHTPCLDGWCAAYAIWYKYHKDTEVAMTFHPMKYGWHFPIGVAEGAWMEDDVIIVDFSFKRPEMLKLAQLVKSILVIDHHVSAEEDLADIELAASNIKCIFDMDHSGCVLTWMHINPGEPMPVIFKYVEDRDLWKWQYGDRTKFITGALYSHPLDNFDPWHYIYCHPRDDDEDNEIIKTLVTEGRAITRFSDQLVSTICDKAGLQEIDGHEVPLVNSSVLQSEVGHELLNRHPDAPFAAVFFEVRDKFRTYSLRARNGEFDVSKIAAAHGGGGHAGAAGFREDLYNDRPIGELHTAEQHPAKTVSGEESRRGPEVVHPVPGPLSEDSPSGKGDSETIP